MINEEVRRRHFAVFYKRILMHNDMLGIFRLGTHMMKFIVLSQRLILVQALPKLPPFIVHFIAQISEP
ncbi:hypothetical protein D3C80_1970790 [compost metagenome]